MIVAQFFEFDPAKAAANERKHGVTFPEAMTTFADSHGLDLHDPDHSDAEDRFIHLGLSATGTLLTTAYTEHLKGADSFVRIINARRATRTETTAYVNSRGTP